MRAETALPARAAIPRLYEELIRMMRGGAARQSISLMAEYGVLELLVPEIFALIPVDDDELVIGNLVRSFRHLTIIFQKSPEYQTVWRSPSFFGPLIQSSNLRGICVSWSPGIFVTLHVIYSVGFTSDWLCLAKLKNRWLRLLIAICVFIES